MLIQISVKPHWLCALWEGVNPYSLALFESYEWPDAPSQCFFKNTIHKYLRKAYRDVLDYDTKAALVIFA